MHTATYIYIPTSITHQISHPIMWNEQTSHPQSATAYIVYVEYLLFYIHYTHTKVYTRGADNNTDMLHNKSLSRGNGNGNQLVQSPLGQQKPGSVTYTHAHTQTPLHILMATVYLSWTRACPIGEYRSVYKHVFTLLVVCKYNEAIAQVNTPHAVHMCRTCTFVHNNVQIDCKCNASDGKVHRASTRTGIHDVCFAGNSAESSRDTIISHVWARRRSWALQ